jgi:hypothetical protein
MIKSTDKTSKESSKKRVDNLLRQGFQRLAKVTPMSPEVGQGPKVSYTTVAPTSPRRGPIMDAGPTLAPFIKRP